MNTIQFGKFLANLRNEKKLTQEDLAEKLYIDKRKISRWECGMSIPDFETLIKLSEILDVTLYELSISQRLEKEKVMKKILYRFKNAKDFRKYRLQKKILLFSSIAITIFLLLTVIYTFKYYGKVDIYEFKSLNDDYHISGTYIKANEYIIYDISRIDYNKNKKDLLKNIDNCEYSIYNNTSRVFQSISTLDNINSKSDHPRLFYYGRLLPDVKINGNLEFRIMCQNKQNQQEEHLITFEFIKKYENKLF